MQSTRSLRALGKLFDGYHEATLSKQQSQKLLEDLKTSFRTNLDREHGHSPRSPPAISKVLDTAKPTTTRQSAVQHHLRTILSNPMFNQSRPDPVEAASSASYATTRDPMEVFDHAVSRGMMNLRAATGILQAKRQQMQNGSDAQSSSSDAGVALRVVRWLHSSETRYDFLENQPFVKALMPFLVMEGMEATVWEWFAEVIKKIEKHEDKEQVRSAAALLRELVLFKAGSRESNNLDEAIACLLQADESLPSDASRDWVLPQAWRKISWLATVDKYKTSTASQLLYDAHIAAGSHFAPNVDIETAHLHLHHPTHPDCTPALQLFEKTSRVRRIAQDPSPKRSRMPPWIVILAHDAMNSLLRAGKHSEAEHLAKLLKSGMEAIFPPDESTGLDTILPAR